MSLLANTPQFLLALINPLTSELFTAQALVWDFCKFGRHPDCNVLGKVIGDERDEPTPKFIVASLYFWAVNKLQEKRRGH